MKKDTTKKPIWITEEAYRLLKVYTKRRGGGLKAVASAVLIEEITKRLSADSPFRGGGVNIV